MGTLVGNFGAQWIDARKTYTELALARAPRPLCGVPPLLPNVHVDQGSRLLRLTSSCAVVDASPVHVVGLWGSEAKSGVHCVCGDGQRPCVSFTPVFWEGATCFVQLPLPTKRWTQVTFSHVSSPSLPAFPVSEDRLPSFQPRQAPALLPRRVQLPRGAPWSGAGLGQADTCSFPGLRLGS